MPPESVALIVKDPDEAELEVPAITPVEEFNVIEEGRDPDTTEYVMEDPPSASVADKVVEYASAVKNVGSVADVTQTGAFPTVVEFNSLCTFVEVGFAIPGFATVTVYGEYVVGISSGLVTNREVDELLTIDFAFLATESVPVNTTVTSDAKF